jgi:MSHA pilin protein MshC
MNGRAPNSARQRGVTLVELVTVIVILGVVGSMAVPRWFDNQVFEERGYVNDLASAIRHAQRIAIASGCQVQLTVAANSYSAMQRAPAGNTCDPAGAWTQAVPRQDGTSLSATAPAAVITNPAATFVFEPDGRIIAAAPPLLSIGAFTLSVDGSGNVTVQP